MLIVAMDLTIILRQLKEKDLVILVILITGQIYQLTGFRDPIQCPESMIGERLRDLHVLCTSRAVSFFIFLSLLVHQLDYQW